MTVAEANRGSVHSEKGEGRFIPVPLVLQTRFHQNAKGSRPRREVANCAACLVWVSSLGTLTSIV